MTEDITVPEGESTVIEEGCQLFFHKSTGMIVEGNLAVEGTKEQPVLFTSINDSLSPEKTDLAPDSSRWNGILIGGTCRRSVEFSRFTLAWSSYGIRSRKSQVVISGGIFRHNETSNFMIETVVPI